MTTDNIDDLLTASMTGQPLPPFEPTAVEEPSGDNPSPVEEAVGYEKKPTDEYGLDEPTEEAPIAEPQESDEYGNKKSAAKTYTQDELDERINQVMRERIARLEKNHQPTQQQQQQAQQAGFEYNAESGETWQQQLAQFTEQVIEQRERRQSQQSQQVREQQAYEEHALKMQLGASKFADFKDVVATQPITDAMALATRAMKDPAAFLYAAAKRAPDKLKEISQIADPYAQAAAIGRLEQQMRQNKPATKAPKPLASTKGDVVIEHKSEREPSIDELLVQNDAKRKAQMAQQRRR